MMKRIAILSLAVAVPALMSVPASAQIAGVTAAVNPEASRTPPGQAVRTVVLGDNIVQNEKIDTTGAGLVQILLADGTTFTVGPNSSISIDRFVFDPNAGTAEVTATMTRGVFRFIGGRTSKTQDGVRLNTPVGTVGIRGGMVDINLTPSQAGLLAHFDLLFGNEVTLEGQAGNQRIYSAGYSLWVDALGRLNTGRTPPQWRTQIFQNLAGSGGNGGSPNRPTNEQVAASNVPSSNSNLPPVTTIVPTPRPPQPDVVQPAAPRTYSGQTFNGFAAGMTAASEYSQYSRVYRNTKTRQVRAEFDGDDGPFYGRIKAGFGSVDETFGAVGEPSAYIDDENFGALSFDTFEEGEGEESDYASSNDGFMISGRSNIGLAPNLDGFDLCDDCDFLQWGWWGTAQLAYGGSYIEEDEQLIGT
jgi:hypothetical protein